MLQICEQGQLRWEISKVIGSHIQEPGKTQTHRHTYTDTVTSHCNTSHNPHTSTQLGPGKTSSAVMSNLNGHRDGGSDPKTYTRLTKLPTPAVKLVSPSAAS